MSLAKWVRLRRVSTQTQRHEASAVLVSSQLKVRCRSWFPVHFVDWSLVSVLRRRSCSCGQVLCVSAAARRWLGCAAHLAPCRPGGAATWLLGLASAARRFSAAVGGRLGSSAAAPQLGGSAARRLGGSAARWLGGSSARWLGGSVTSWLGGSVARQLGSSAARRLGVFLWLGTRIMRACARFARGGPLYSRPKARQHSSAVDVRVIEVAAVVRWSCFARLPALRHACWLSVLISVCLSVISVLFQFYLNFTSVLSQVDLRCISGCGVAIPRTSLLTHN